MLRPAILEQLIAKSTKDGNDVALPAMHFVAPSSRGIVDHTSGPEQGGTVARTLNLTVLLQGVTPEDQLGYHRGFERLVADGSLSGYRPFPYRGLQTPNDWAEFYDAVARHMLDTGSNALLCQFFHWQRIADPRPFLQRVALLPQRPVIATSCGDPFGPFLARPPASLTQAGSCSDITFVSSMGHLADRLQRAGTRRITLVPLAACDERFASEPPLLADGSFDGSDREFDVVFIGSRSGGRNATNHLFWSGRRRAEAVHQLTKRYGHRFGLFGHGWDGLASRQGPIAFNDQVSTCQRARVVFGGYPGSHCDYYTSNRPMIQALSGTPIVDHAVPRVDTLLEPGAEWLLARDIAETIAAIDSLLADPERAQSIGRHGADAVRSRHLDSHRTRLIVDIMNEVHAAKVAGRKAVCPPLDFFCAGVDAQSEMATALRAW